MKRIRFQPDVPAQVRAIEQGAAIRILEAIHKYAETGAGNVKTLSGWFEGLRHLRVGDHPVLFDEETDAITIHRVGNRREVYR